MQEIQIQKAIQESSSFRGAARKLGKPYMHQWLKKKAIEMGIDFSHFQHGHIYSSMVGTKIGYLKIVSIRPLNDKHRRVMALCQCDCGNKKEIRCDSLKDGKYVSCGCHSKNRWNTVASLNHQFKGMGELRGTYYSRLRRMAEKRNLEFSVSLKELWELFLKQKGLCALTGVAIGFGRVYYANETTASPDRIDNSKGYISGNIRWVLKDINMIRGSYDSEYFIKLCNLVAQQNPRKLELNS